MLIFRHLCNLLIFSINEKNEFVLIISGLHFFACVVLIPYERTRIEVLAAACLCGTDTLRTNPYRSACWCLLHYRFVPCWCLLAGAWLLACWCLVACLLLVLAALQVRALLVLACVILIPYERTCIEVLAGACLCGTDTLQTNPYRSACSCLFVWY